MTRAPAARLRLAIGVAGALAAVTTALSACAPVSCSAEKVADHFTIVATSATHLHPLLALCEGTSCTQPLNASSTDRGASVGRGPSLALYATSVDHWRVAVGELENGTPARDPSDVTVALSDRTTPLLTRTIHPSWHRASGACSDFTTANTVLIRVP